MNGVIHLYFSQLSSSWNTCHHHLMAPGFFNIKLSWSSFIQGWVLHAFYNLLFYCYPYVQYAPVISKYLSQVSMPFQMPTAFPLLVHLPELLSLLFSSCQPLTLMSKFTFHVFSSGGLSLYSSSLLTALLSFGTLFMTELVPCHTAKTCFLLSYELL